MEMCGNGVWSTSHWKVVQLKRAFWGESLEPNLRPCSRNKNSVNENKKSYPQIAKTLSVGLYIHQGEVQNTKQNEKLWSETIFETFSVSFILIIFSISGAIPQIDEFIDR